MTPNLFAVVVSAAVLVSVAALGAILLYALSIRTTHKLKQRVAGKAEVVDGGERTEGRLLDSLSKSGLAMGKTIDREGELAQLLIQAGARDAGARTLFYGIWGLWGFICAVSVIGAVLFVGAIKAKVMYVAIACLVGVSLAYLGPIRCVRAVAGARRDRIQQEVPLFINVLVLLFEAGLSTRQALYSIVREGHGVLPELGKEFENIIRQLDAGAELSPCLQRLADMLQVESLKGIIGILRQVDRYGGEIREPLLEALEVIQERAALDVRERVNIISGRMTVVMVTCFLPALLAFTMAPAFIAIIHGLRGVGH